MTPTIQTQIGLLKDTKRGTRTAIMEKGVTVSPNDLFSVYPTRISQISMTAGDQDGLLSDLIEGTTLTSFTIPTGTDSIRFNAFYRSSLTSVTIPNTVQYIGSWAFAHSPLASVTIPSNTRIGQYVFYNCTNLATAVFGSGTTFGNYAFNGCTALNGIEFPETLTSISSSAFAGCTSLTEITIPANVSSIGSDAFKNCSGLTKITCLSETPPSINTTYLPFENTNNCPIYVPEESVQAYKTAWPTYSSRIQAIPVIRVFEKVTDINDVTSGKYLMVDTATGKALNASLINNTTSSTNGINGTSNLNCIDVTILNGTITENWNTLNAAADYDADNKTLSWTDTVNEQSYFIQWKSSTSYAYGNDRFNQLNNTIPKTVNGNITFGTSGSTTRSIGKHNSYDLIKFYSESNSSYYTSIALFKLSQ